MQKFAFKTGNVSTLVEATVTPDEMTVLKATTTMTVGYGKHQETRLLSEYTYQRKPRGSAEPKWSIFGTNGYVPINSDRVPAEVRQAFIYAFHPIKKGDGKAKVSNKGYVDIDTVAAFLARKGAQRNFAN